MKTFIISQTFSRRLRYARLHRNIACFLLGGIALQYFSAGLGVFGITSFMPHAIWGALLILTSFSLPVVALAGQLARNIIWRSSLVAGLMIVQGLLIDLGRIVHVVWAFHPVNALILALLVYGLARSRLPEPSAFFLPERDESPVVVANPPKELVSVTH
jgi:hypothetical protein